MHFAALLLQPFMLLAASRSLALGVISPVQKHSLWPLKTWNGQLLLCKGALLQQGAESGQLSIILDIRVVLLRSIWLLSRAKILCRYGIYKVCKFLCN